MAPGVPLKVIVVIDPEQIVVVPEMEAVGKAFTVTTALPDCVCEHTGEPVEATLTKE